MHIEILQIVQTAAPTIVRTVVLPVAKEALTHVVHTMSHKGVHAATHAAGHKSHFAHRLFNKGPSLFCVDRFGVKL
jgi:hypothetical protein